MPDIKFLAEKNNEVFYPVTHESGVRDSDGVSLSTKLGQSNAILANIANTVSTHDSEINAISGREGVIAWDGESSPEVGDIPYGVTVTYDETDYTGTLVASSSTLGSEYYVAAGDGEYDRYITVKNGSSYYWFKYGTTRIDLSGYQRIDDEVWLTEEEFEELEVKDPTKTYNVYEEVSTL